MTKIAIAQINPTVGDLNRNREKILAALKSGREQGAKIVVTPECVISGYMPEDLLLRKKFIEDCMASVKKIAEAVADVWLIVGTPWSEEGKLYNAAVVMHQGKITGVAKKHHLPNYSVFDEKRYFTKGNNKQPVEVAGLKCAITICEDIWVDEGDPAELSARDDVDLIINLSASPFYLGKDEQRREKAKAWASRYNKPLLYCNLVGGQDELVFDGSSFLCNAKGCITAGLNRFKEEVAITDINSGGTIAAQLPYPENIFEALKTGVRDYVQKNGFTKVIIGLSGGIDSALTASIAVAALGKQNVWGVAMPSKYSSDGSVEDARLLAKNHDIKFDIIPIESIVNSFENSLKPFFEGTEVGVAEENIQARSRGNIIMSLSNKFGCMVLSTGNKSEMSVGYCTLYGDMAGGLSVISDLTKLKVYELSKWINKNKNLPNIPSDTITKPPSAELREQQKDSDSLPEYEQLDPILKAYIEEEKSIEEILPSGYSDDEINRIIRMVDLSEYKRRQAAPGIKISPKAFGKDRRMPITNRYR